MMPMYARIFPLKKQTKAKANAKTTGHTLKCGSRALADNIIAPLIWHIVIIIFLLDLCDCTFNENRFSSRYHANKHKNKNMHTDDCNDFTFVLFHSDFCFVVCFIRDEHIPAMDATDFS